MKIIGIKDYYGEYHKVPVTDEFYIEWIKLQNESQRVRHLETYHRSFQSLEYADTLRAREPRALEDDYIKNKEILALYEAIPKLTAVQRRRILQLLDGMSVADIARQEHRHYSSTRESIIGALRKLRALMEQQ